ncbi:MAG: gluconolaconase [Phycisphaerae bacterium]
MLLTLGMMVPACAAEPRLDRIRLPEGFRIDAYSSHVPGARSMTLGEKGTLFVGTRREGKVYAVLDQDNDGRAERVITLASGLKQPNGVAFREGDLYVAETTRILRFEDIESQLERPPRPFVVSRQFPEQDSHEWKFIAFGPDDLLYVPVGAPCNACIRREQIYASITRMKSSGGEPEIFADGVRNTVGFDWHPETKELWFTENGRDWLGDNRPPDELNRAPRAGMHFGYPYCFGESSPDPEYNRGRDCDRFTPPVLELPAHVAALGMRFYTGRMFPKEYRHQIFIAEHGSWNRSTPIGYRVSLARIDADKQAKYEVFAEGWLQGSEAWGRPVDVQVAPDGALLVSDDKAGAIYRISHAGRSSTRQEGPR